MTQKKGGDDIALIAGIFFAVSLVWNIITFSFSIIRILQITGIAAISFLLITKRRDIVLCVGFSVVSIVSLIGQVRTYVAIVSAFGKVFWTYDFVFSWLKTLGYIASALICIAEITDYIPQLKEVGKKAWFVPAILVGPSIFTAFVIFIDSFDFGSLLYFLLTILSAAAFFLSMMWVVYPDGLPNTAKPVANNKVNNNIPASLADEVYCGLVKHILLLLFTFGIWFLIWIYRVTGYTNSVKDEENRNPTTKLLLCMFVPFYQVYWTYKTAQRIDKMASSKGLQSDLSTLCLILAIFVPIIPPILMQDKLNNMATAGDVKATLTQKPQTAYSTVLGTAEELKSYKELFDDGVITQEEFDAKKKQLLGL